MTDERKMTAKGWLHKSTQPNAANSAEGFLAQYRDFLQSGSLAPVTTPILLKMDSGEVTPDVAFKAVQNVVMTHIIASDMLKAEQAMEDAANPGTQKNWLVSIRDLEDNIVVVKNAKGEDEELVKAFDKSSDADRWSDRRLFDGAPDWYGVVEFTKNPKIRTVIYRQDSMARIMRKGRGPVVQQKGQSTKTLGFGVKAKETRVTFSKG